MVIKQAQRNQPELQKRVAYFLLAIMWVIWLLAFYLLWQKAAT